MAADTEQAEALWRRAEILQNAGKPRRSIHLYDQAQATGYAEVETLHMSAVAARSAGWLWRRRKWLREARRRLQEALLLSEPGSAKRAAILADLGDVYSHLGMHDEAERRFDEAEALHAKHGNRMGTGIVQGFRVRHLAREGRLEDALDQAETALKTLRGAEDLRPAMHHWAILTELRIRLGQRTPAVMEALAYGYLARQLGFPARVREARFMSRTAHMPWLYRRFGRTRASV